MADVSELLTELDDHGFDSVSPTRKLSALNAAYYNVCGREPWPFLETGVVRLLFSGTSYEPTNPPVDLRAVTSMKLEGTGGYPLTYIRSDDYDNAYGDNTIIAIGNPRLFTIDGARALHFYPAPSAAQVVRVRYIKRPAALTAVTLEAAIALPLEYQRDILINGAAYRLLAMDDDTDVAPTFVTFYENAIETMREFLWADQHVTPQFVHPVSFDDLGIDPMGPFGV